MALIILSCNPQNITSVGYRDGKTKISLCSAVKSRPPSRTSTTFKQVVNLWRFRAKTFRRKLKGLCLKRRILFTSFQVVRPCFSVKQQKWELDGLFMVTPLNDIDNIEICKHAKHWNMQKPKQRAWIWKI